MAGGKRFAGDFQRIDAVKPADKLLIQDSSDERVKFTFTTQFADSLGGVAQGVAPIYFLEFNTPANTTGTLTFDEPIYWVGVGYRNTFEGVPANAKVAMQIYNRFCLITYCPLNNANNT